MRAVWPGAAPAGFSQKTWRPAAAAAAVISSWNMLGAQMTTTSTPGASTAARQSSKARWKP